MQELLNFVIRQNHLVDIITSDARYQVRNIHNAFDDVYFAEVTNSEPKHTFPVSALEFQPNEITSILVDNNSHVQIVLNV